MLTYGFFGSKNGDRKYSAAQFSSIFDGIITDGIFPNIYEKFIVKPGSTYSNRMHVVIRPGKGWFNNVWVQCDSNETLSVQNADPNLYRKDSIFLYVDKRDDHRNAGFTVLTGTNFTTSNNPTAPEPTSVTNVYYYRLADVLIQPAATEITAADITMYIGTTIPFITGAVQNVSVDYLYSQWSSAWTSWFNGFKTSANTALDNKLGELNDTFDTWFASKKSAINQDWTTWFTNSTTSWSSQFTNWYNNRTSAWESTFNTWYNGKTSTWESNFNTWYNDKTTTWESNMQAWSDAFVVNWDQRYDDIYARYNELLALYDSAQSEWEIIMDWMEERKTEFQTWFASLQTQIEEDAVISLTNAQTKLKQRMDYITSEGLLYHDLGDGDDIITTGQFGASHRIMTAKIVS